MPDITMCSNDTCFKRHHCYRSIAEPSLRQSITYFTPVQDCYMDGTRELDRIKHKELKE